MLACAKLYKEKGSIVHRFTCLCMENHLWKFQPKRTHISWDINENINKENKKNSGFGEERSHTIIIDNFLQWVFLSKFFAIFWFLWTPSDNSFTISPHNLALLHSTLLHSYIPSTFKDDCQMANPTIMLFSFKLIISKYNFQRNNAKTGVLNSTPVGVNRGPHPQVLTLHPVVST